MSEAQRVAHRVNLEAGRMPEKLLDYLTETAIIGWQVSKEIQ
jgi:hypothetical protein